MDGMINLFFFFMKFGDFHTFPIYLYLNNMRQLDNEIVFFFGQW